MSTKQRLPTPAILLAALAAIAGCSRQSAAESDAGTNNSTLTGAGSTLVAPLYRKWFDLYHSEHPSTMVDYQVVGSGEGTKLFLGDSVDFGASDAGLADDQLASVDRGAILVPMTAAMIVLAYNPDGMPPHLKLPRDVYVDIFLGKVTKWNDERIAAANPGVPLPPNDIAVAVRNDGSGTTFAFTNHLAAISERWRNGPGVGTKVGWPNHTLHANGNEGVASLVERTLGAIGYVEYGTAKQVGLRMASLENKAGHYIEPSGATGLATILETKMPANLRVYISDPEGMGSYPIVTYSWLLLYRHYDQSKSAQIRDLVRWCLDQGQQYSESLGYIRLAPHVVAAANSALDKAGF